MKKIFFSILLCFSTPFAGYAFDRETDYKVWTKLVLKPKYMKPVPMPEVPRYGVYGKSFVLPPNELEYCIKEEIKFSGKSGKEAKELAEKQKKLKEIEQEIEQIKLNVQQNSSRMNKVKTKAATDPSYRRELNRMLLMHRNLIRKGMALSKEYNIIAQEVGNKNIQQETIATEFMHRCKGKYFYIEDLVDVFVRLGLMSRTELLY